MQPFDGTSSLLLPLLQLLIVPWYSYGEGEVTMNRKVVRRGVEIGAIFPFVFTHSTHSFGNLVLLIHTHLDTSFYLYTLILYTQIKK